MGIHAFKTPIRTIRSPLKNGLHEPINNTFLFVFDTCRSEGVVVYTTMELFCEQDDNYQLVNIEDAQTTVSSSISSH